jgi:hypothetical protein
MCAHSYVADHGWLCLCLCLCLSTRSMCIDPSERVDQIHKGRRSTCVCPVTEASSFRHVTGYMVYYYVRYGSMAIWSLAACLVLAKKKKKIVVHGRRRRCLPDGCALLTFYSNFKLPILLNKLVIYHTLCLLPAALLKIQYAVLSVYKKYFTEKH